MAKQTRARAPPRGVVQLGLIYATGIGRSPYREMACPFFSGSATFLIYSPRAQKSTDFLVEKVVDGFTG